MASLINETNSSGATTRTPSSNKEFTYNKLSTEFDQACTATKVYPSTEYGSLTALFNFCAKLSPVSKPPQRLYFADTTGFKP